MVKHHILIGLGFKKNSKNRALNYMMNRGKKQRIIYWVVLFLQIK